MQKKGVGQPKIILTEVAKAVGTEAFQRSPKKSIWLYQWESGVSYGSMQWLLKEMNWRPLNVYTVLLCEDCVSEWSLQSRY